MKEKTKLTFRDMGKPEAVKDEASGVLHLARVFGVATHVITRNMPTGEKYEGLKGSFRAVRGNGEVINAPAIYFPDALHKLVSDALPEKGSAAFCFDIASQKTESGWSLKIDQVLAPEATDPVADLIERIEGISPDTTTVTSPVTVDTPQTPSSTKAKGKASA